VSIPSTVDQNAPVLARHEIDIRAPVETVWRLHTNVNAWTTWQTDITEEHFEGRMERGFAEAMRRGEWMVTHQGIAFDTQGVLVDGQHRLAAKRS